MFFVDCRLGAGTANLGARSMSPWVASRVRTATTGRQASYGSAKGSAVYPKEPMARAIGSTGSSWTTVILKVAGFTRAASTPTS